MSAHATGEVLGAVLEGAGRHPDLAVVWVTPGHAGALEDIGAAVGAVLAPSVLIGVVAAAVLAGPDDTGPPTAGGAPGPGIALWAAQVGPVTPHLVGDPLTCPAAGAVVLADAGAPAVPATLAAATAGGRTSARGVLVQGRVHHGAAVAALLGPTAALRVAAADAARPVGGPHVAGRVAGDLLGELDGRPALEVVRAELADHLPAADLPLARAGLRLVVHGRRLSTAVRGADRATGVLAVGDTVPDGATVRLAVLDPDAAGAALAAAVSGATAAGGPPATALAWRSEARHPAWWEGRSGDAEVLADALGAAPLAGCATVAELPGGAAEAAPATVVALFGHG